MSRGTANTGYIQHTIINIIFLLLARFFLFLQYGLNYRWNWINIVSAAFLFGTIWLNPDIDSNRSLTYRAWTPLLRWYWYPYTYYVSHRGRSYLPLEVKRGIGHNVLLGTLIRLVYASPLFILLKLFVSHFVDINKVISIDIILKIVLGIWLADTLHIIVDFLFHKN